MIGRLLLGLSLSGSAAGEWRVVEPANLLVLDTTKGRILVELRPDLAPNAVDRIRRLARRGVYDGLLFHRVIDGFVDQTGNPNNRDGGGSDLPDLEPEFDARLPSDALVAAATSDGATLGFLGALPAASAGLRDASGRIRTWALYCQGVVGMGRQAGWNTANSEFFFMRGSARRLDHQYTAVGRTLVGLEAVRAVAVGEPPPHPDRLVRVRAAADLSASERPSVEVLREDGPTVAARIQAARGRLGADFSPCAVEPEAREVSR